MRYVFSLLVLFSITEIKANAGQTDEAFDKSLGRLNSLALLNAYIDSCVVVQKVPKHSRQEVFLINKVIERKFYHGYSRYTIKDNFLAYLAGKYIWDHLSAIVLPEDLVKHEMAACSQQAIVMMKVLKLRGFKVRKLGLTGHYVLEVLYNSSWHIFDPNHEPKYQGLAHDSLTILLNNGLITESYSKTLNPERVKQVFSNMQVGKVNSVPAKNARLFHQVTKFLSQIFPLLVIGGTLAIFIILRNKKKSRSKSRGQKVGKCISQQ